MLLVDSGFASGGGQPMQDVADFVAPHVEAHGDDDDGADDDGLDRGRNGIQVQPGGPECKEEKYQEGVQYDRRQRVKSRY